MTLYRLILTLVVLPVLLAGLGMRRLTGRAAPREAAERLALAGGMPQPPIWLHGASNGEITSARWLVDEILRHEPRAGVLITCNNPTARAMVEGWALPRVTAVLAPWDSRGTMRRFLRRWRPRALLTLENELWPERMAACAAAGVPVLAVGARLSARSARLWARLAPGLLRGMLGSVAWLSAQDALSEQRLVAAGLPPDRLGPRLVLKARAAAAPAPSAPSVPFPVAPRARCLLAASTHEGEDAAVIDAFLGARNRFDLLVIAPRHPRRGAEIAALAAARGQAPRLRSRGEAPEAKGIYLADTLGEMALWYAVCGATFVGGSLVPRGGHTPFEPIAAGSAVLHGPSTQNFLEVYATLDAIGGAWPVADAAGLAAALQDLSPEVQSRLAEAARGLPQGADPGPVLDALARLAPLIPHAG